MVYSSNIHKNIQYFYSASNSDRTLDHEIVEYFKAVAEQIITQIEPGSVLVFGGMSQYLVSALRERGIQAFGALESGRILDELSEETKLFYRTETLITLFSRTYDLTICLEVFPLLSVEEAERICEIICASTNDILFSATPFGIKGRTELIIQPPGYWAALFAQHDFYRDVNFSVEFVSPWAFRFRKMAATPAMLAAVYQQRIWELEQEVEARRGYLIEQRNELALKEMELLQAQQQIAFKIAEKEEILNSRSWRTMQKVQSVRLKLIPLGSRQEKWILASLRGVRLWRRDGFRAFASRIYEMLAWKFKIFLLRLRYRSSLSRQMAQFEPIKPPPALQPHKVNVDLVICVHNALEDFQRCLDSVLKCTSLPFSLILIDDGSDTPTQEYLVKFAAQQQANLIRNEDALGYTRAANQGMRAARGDFIVLLNSDTIVTSGWLDRMIACAESQIKNGIVGPLSNTASWQSIPEFESNGDWATNPLPDGVSIQQMAEYVEVYSAQLFPIMPFLNGFCLLIRKQVIDEIGYFDEENFGQGYGEENDFCLRARKAGWRLILADNTYIFHAQSKSYSSERRKQLSERAGEILAQKHGRRIIDQGVEFCRWSPVLEGIRARSRIIFVREEMIALGMRKYSARKVLFILPIQVPGGGANVVTNEVRAMRAMGVDAQILNLQGHREGFTRVYPNLDIPVVYVEIDEIPRVSKMYDAVIATFNPSVSWMASGAKENDHTVWGYYIQDFEPYFYPADSEGYRQAWDSYSLIPNLKRITKTDWTRREVRSQIGLESRVVGPSFNLDLFRPRPRKDAEWPDRPLRIAAMVRPSSAYRAPKETMETLHQVAHYYGSRIEIILFGTTADDPGFMALQREFPWQLAGVLNQQQIASLLNEVDIFVDFSTYQALGLTALEAMACGAAVILPNQGGTKELAKDHVNSLLIDTSSESVRWEALKCLIEDYDLRIQLQRNAIRDVCEFYPEGPAYRILDALFGG